MRKVAIVGLGTTKFKARHIDKTYYELAFEAAKATFENAGLSKEDVDCVVYGIYNDFFARQYQPDGLVNDYIGMVPKPEVRVNTGGATGGSAIRIGYAEIASGLYDTCLVLGVEKCGDCYNYELAQSTPEVLKPISYTADMNYDFPSGRTAAGVFALCVVAHQEKYNGQPTEEQMAKVSVKNHRNALLNPIAQSGMELTVEEAMNSRMIAKPFKKYDNCLYTEGASAVILACEEKAKEITDKPIWITGLGAATDWPIAGNRENLYEFASSRIAAQRAYKMAGMTNPRKELDLCELHDAFSGLEILNYEDIAITEPGKGGYLIDEGIVEPSGDLPVNTSGGLIGCGHAVGATGIMQTIEICLQLREEAGQRQVKGAKRGLVQSIGGSYNTWTVCIILERKE